MPKIIDERVGRQPMDIAGAAALQVAHDYKVPVFPCDWRPLPGKDGPSKTPLIKDWPHAASTDPEVIAAWWRQWPNALVGVPTGARSGLLAVDCDPKGQRWFQANKERLGTYRLHQTRRGKHLLYQYPSQGEVRNSTSQVAAGVDVRGEGGYVIWWAAHGMTALGSAGVLPPWLADLLVKRKLRRLNGHANGHGGEWAEEVTEGGRSDWLSKRAYSLAKAGWGVEKILADLRALNAHYCKPPVSERELRTIAQGKQRFVPVEAQPIAQLMSQIEEEEVNWLWKGFLARNKVHVIAGAGATMKSTLTLSLAATVTKGGEWPDGSQCAAGNVILWTGEDDLGDTVKPRFRYAGGDQDRCTVLVGVQEEETRRAFDMGQDFPLLERVCTELKEVSLIVIDPIVVIVSKDNNSVSDVRRALLPLQDLAKRHNAVVLGIQHFNKGSKGRDPVERITGSGAWSQAPRIVLATAPINDGDGKDPTKYVFTCIKTFAKKQHGGYEYGFEEEPRTEVARIVWGRFVDGTGHAIITEAEGDADGKSKLGDAKNWLRELLIDGPMTYFEIGSLAMKAGIKGITLKRARESLGLLHLREKGKHFWSLPGGSRIR